MKQTIIQMMNFYLKYLKWQKKDGTIYEQNKPIFPDMTLYQEIIFLDNYFGRFFKGQKSQNKTQK